MNSDRQFKAVLEMLVPMIIKEITNQKYMSDEDALELLYSSFLYSALEIEVTKLWHLSPITLANLLFEEIETGTIIFPEEA
jgi:hypothetical protein